MEGLAIYESQICACGIHESIAKTNPDMDIDLPVCPVCAGFAQQMRVLHARDDEEVKGLGQSPAPEAKRPTDGRRVTLKFKPPSEEST